MRFLFITEVDLIVEAESLEDVIKLIEDPSGWDSIGYVNSEYAAHIMSADPNSDGKILKDYR